MEENIASGGFGEHVSAYLMEIASPMDVLTIAIPDGYVEHGSVSALLKELKMDPAHLAHRIMEVL